MEVRETRAEYLAKPGVKQTEVGEIPADWQCSRLGDFADVSAGGTPSRSIAEYWGGEIPWVTTAEVDFKIVSSTVESISRLGLNNSAAKLLKPDTLLMALYGQGKTRGKVAILGIEAATNQACAAIEVGSNVAWQYIYQFLVSNYESIRQLSNSGSQENLTGAIVRSIPVPLPPAVEEQQAIAGALGDADALIESLEHLLAKKRQIKQGTMQALLTGQQRLPGFEGGWQTQPMAELFNFSGGLTASRNQLGAHGLCYLHYGDIHTASKNFIDVDADFEHIPKLDVPIGDVGRGQMLEDGDVVFVDASEDEDGTSKHVVVVNPGGVSFISGLHTIVAKSKTHELDNLYKRYCFQTAAVKEQFRYYSVGTKVSGVSKSNIGKISIRVPPKDEQTAIATVLTDMDAEIAALDARLAKARALKQGMMQTLLTGRIRLV